MPASSASSARRSAESGVSSAGLRTIGVAAGECGPELPGGDVEREVPGDDEADDAERLSEGHVDAAGDGDRLAVALVDGAGVEVEDVGDHADLAAGAADRLADVGGFDACELLVVLFDEGREPAEQPPAVSGRNRPPSRKGAPGRRHRRVGLGNPSRLEGRNRLLGRRIDDGDGHACDLTMFEATSFGEGPVFAAVFLDDMRAVHPLRNRGRVSKSSRSGLGSMERTRVREADRRGVAAPVGRERGGVGRCRTG